MARDRFFKRVRISKALKPALGGLMLGVIAFALPQVMDGGYGWVQAALEGKIFWGTMLLLALMKIAATSCTISSGGSGGAFGPSVFMGAMLGGAFGFIVAKDVAIPNVVRVGWHESLQEALDKMVRLKVDELPVVREESPDKIVGMISKRDIISYYHSRGGGGEEQETGTQDDLKGHR